MWHAAPDFDIIGVVLRRASMSREIKIGDATLKYEIQTDENTNKRFAVITGAKVEGALAITNEIEDCPVTSIRSWAFEGCSELKSVTIPDSVTSIESSAFERCYWLTSIQVADGNPSYKS